MKDKTSGRCPIYKRCGGCQLQNLDYESQLSHKQVRLIRLLGRFCHVDEIIGMDDPYHYRNKLQCAYTSRGGRLVGGIYRSSTGGVTEVGDTGCMIEDELSGRISYTLTRLLAKHKVPAYNFDKRTGIVRHTLIRIGKKSGQIMVVIVTPDCVFRSLDEITTQLVSAHPEITTVVRNINSAPLRISLGSENRVLYGPGYIEDSLMGLTFRISPCAFYQVNPQQTEVLYSLAREYAALTGKETVIDAYSGTGTIGMIMADKAKSVISVEQNPSAVEDALVNARLNRINNIHIHRDDAGKFMRKMARRGESADVLITDPPRSGCSKEFLECTLALSPKRIVYVSCNPETLARDLSYLTKNGYRVQRICGVDMFPYTDHVETVVLLTRR